MDIVFGVENEFYLTGGTCLSRFYHEKRYSDDLDFFTNDSLRFSFAVKNIKRELLKRFVVTPEIEAKDFIRFRVEHHLQVDFVNDRTPRFKDVVIRKNGYIIDNVENILANKLTAVIGRDNPKDVFDIYLICRFYSFDWGEIVDAASNKAVFALEDLVVKLKSFPVSLFDKIEITDPHFLDGFNAALEKIIDEIVKKEYHRPIYLNR
ncbi:hypothetical protein NNO_0341 [Hydrogenimonas sp.]|nr:hypothetical protein NNO_0341 [Hydrogenimonas sp.]